MVGSPPPQISQGSPIQEGQGSYTNGAGADSHYPTTAADAGIIVGVIIIVIAGVVGLFVWRVRKNRKARDGEAGLIGVERPENELPTPPKDSDPERSVTPRAESHFHAQRVDNSTDTMEFGNAGLKQTSPSQAPSRFQGYLGPHGI